MFCIRVGFGVLATILGVALWVGAQTPVQTGYAVLTSESGRPAGSALFSQTNASGVLVSETGVGSVVPIRSGRIFVDEAGTRTAIALVNPSSQTATGTLILRDFSGQEFARSLLSLPAGNHTARFVAELYAGLPPNFTGSLTFDSDQTLAAITLRESQNAQQEKLYTTLPVVPLDAAAASSPTVFPHIAVGDGYTSQLLLMNSSSRIIRGRIHLLASDGRPLLARLRGSTVSDFDYEIAAQGTYRAELEGISGLGAGYATAVPEAGSDAPMGSAIFQLKAGGQLVTESGVGAIPATTAARIFIDYIGTQTGVALANPGGLAADLTFTLMDRNGVEEASVRQTIPAGNHLARFAHELFPRVADGYTGLMEIRSSNPIVPITLKLTLNTRGNLVLTTLPVADLNSSSTAGTLVFPHIALGNVFTTRLILLNASTAGPGGGRLSFFQSDGSSLTVPMGGVTGNQFSYQLTPGGGRRFYPGNAAGVSSVALIDAASNQPTNELIVNEGNTVPVQLQILDSTGARRDDFDASVTSLDPEIAVINPSGGVQGKKAGFSTLTIAVGGRLITATATVVKVDAGVSGFEATGIVQDSARRLYLASTQQHDILLAQDLKQTPQVYAGIAGSAGLKNDLRRESLFNNPAFLALNYADGSLYVSDAANHVIRRVRAGQSGRVETLAGIGTAGSRDGSAAEAAFNNPQGIALDERGNLWIADSGNHTIRRINILTGRVETIAGQAGVAGSVDGRGDQARFRSPAGIAVETETQVRQLERLRRGERPPPVTVIVADAGNGLIRRVYETGQVETLGSAQPVSQASTAAGLDTRPNFASPGAVAIDAVGNIYVTEPGLGRVRALLTTGEVVSAVQPGTLEKPQGIFTGQNGKVLVAGRDRAARELVYGEPRITSITPGSIGNRGGQRITVKGANFAPDSLVVLAGVVMTNRSITNTQEITFTAPPLSSGRSTLTVQNRGGLAQASLQVDPVPLNELTNGYITTVAGGSTYAGEGTPALTAPIVPWALAVDSSGNVLVADIDNNRVRRIDGRTGTIITVAGTGVGESDGENGPAIAAGLKAPTGVAFDPAGNLLIAEGYRIRKVDPATGIITTVVGGGEYGFCGDRVEALKACFTYITGFTVDSAGNIYITDYYNRRVSRVDVRTQIMTTVAGNGREGFSGDGGDARSATINSPYGVAVDEARQILYFADSGNGRVRKVDLATNLISTVAGGGDRSSDGPALGTDITPVGLAVDAAGDLFIATVDRIRKVDVRTGLMTTVAGGGSPANRLGDGGAATAAEFGKAWAVTLDGGGNMFIGDFGGYRVRKVEATTQTITSIAGNGSAAALSDNSPAVSATVRDPSGVSIDSAGNLYITDTGHDRIRKVDAVTRIITTVAGGGNPEIHTENIPATDAHFHYPTGRVAIDDAGNLYIADYIRVSKVDARTQRMTTFAGNGRDETSGDGGPAIGAGVRPLDLAVDRRGNLYIAEEGRVRRVNLSTGLITTVVGGLGPELRIAVDAAGNLFISDFENGRIRRVDASSNTITTVAGGGRTDCGLNQLATSVTVLPVGLAVDSGGNLLFVDWCWPPGVRKVSATTGVITSVAGGESPALGDNGFAISASFFYPTGMTIDAAGNIFIADTRNQRIRAIRGPIP